jgi:MEMO1 family protein
MAAPAPRSPAVAGAFYPASGQELARRVEACFRDPRGPGDLPARRRSSTRELQAAVVPHAGYVYSGPIAAHVYSRLAAERPPATVLILGVDHHGASAGAALSDRAWLTPLGPTAVDHDLVRALARGPIAIDESAHAREYSIEVQLPFLEYVLPHPQFVALEVGFGPFRFLEEVAGIVHEALEGRDVLVLASTDFSHYVPPPVADRLDHLAIDQILARDPRGLYDTVQRHRISMCGIAPTTVLLAATRTRSWRAELLKWGHSGEADPMDEVVGYAAIALGETDRSAVR